MAPRCSYVVPFRRITTADAALEELAADFCRLRSAGCEVIVVDGSPGPDYARHARAWAGLCRHVPVDQRWHFLNGKVNGVLTGVFLARHERVILADDDVVYGAADIRRMCALLAEQDLVVPQNFFTPLPWWARIETGRILLNRAVRPAGDYPGTFGVRRSAFVKIGPYDGNVLFENEELRRHFIRCRLRVKHARDFLIARRPPSRGKWWEQRLRQAYEDLGARAKTLLFLLLLPMAVTIAWIAGPHAAAKYAASVALVAATLAAIGRRDGAAAVMPLTACFWAPLWVVERAVTVYAAIWVRLVRGGCMYGGRLIARGSGQAAA